MSDASDKANAKKAAVERTQQQADAAASNMNEDKPSQGKFNWWDTIVNVFVDHNSGKPDWTKVLLTGLGGLAAGVMGADLGIGGMLLAGTIGTLVAGFATAMLVPMARGDDPNATHRNHVVPRPFSPDPNTKVITQTPITLGDRTINIPAYNPNENKDVKPGIADPQLRTAIEDLRKIAGDGNPYDSPANKHLREMVNQLENKENIREINLRYLRDTLPQAQQGAVGQVDEYLSKLGPDAQQALSIKLNADLSKVPGMQGGLGNDLERYGREIKGHLLKELAATGGSVSTLENQKVLDSAWDNMSVVAKRNFINNFANEAIQNAMDNKASDARAFFPETETPMGIIGYRPNLSTWLLPDVLGATREAQYRWAATKTPPDFETMADILDKRIAEDPTLPQGSRLSDGITQQMQALALGMHAKGEVKKLDTYIAGPLHAELEQLSGFEAALKDQNQRIISLPSKVQAYTQGKNQPGTQVTFSQEILDKVGGLSSETSLAFQNASSPPEASNTIPTRPVDLKKKLANPSQSVG